MKMVSPFKANRGTVRSSSKAIRELTQLHFRHHSERAAWRDQLEALKTTLEELPNPSPSNQPSEASIIYLRERCKDLEEMVEREKKTTRLLTEALEKVNNEAEKRQRQLQVELENEKRKSDEANSRLAELLRVINRISQNRG